MSAVHSTSGRVLGPMPPPLMQPVTFDYWKHEYWRLGQLYSELATWENELANRQNELDRWEQDLTIRSRGRRYHPNSNRTQNNNTQTQLPRNTNNHRGGGGNGRRNQNQNAFAATSVGGVPVSRFVPQAQPQPAPLQQPSAQESLPGAPATTTNTVAT